MSDKSINERKQDVKDFFFQSLERIENEAVLKRRKLTLSEAIAEMKKTATAMNNNDLLSGIDRFVAEMN